VPSEVASKVACRVERLEPRASGDVDLGVRGGRLVGESDGREGPEEDELK
jgi:hypothetical protein